MAGSARLGAALQGFRQRAGLTQQEAADRASLSVAGLRDVEQGRVVAPRPATLRRLALALGLSEAEARELRELADPVPARAAGVWIGVLGPLLVRVDGAEVDPGSDAQRVLLGLLALSPNAPVGRGRLAEKTSGARTPSTSDALPARISRLRRRLRSDHRPAPALEAGDGGYQLTVRGEQLDLLEFRGQLARARQQRGAGELAAACDRYATAVGLWRGEPLAGLVALADDPVVVGVVGEWRSAVVEYAAVAAELGRHAEVVPVLQRAVQADPWHEPAHARLMVALAGSGRPAAALATYDALRRRLADEVRSAPGPELAEAHRRVLRQQVARPEVTPVSAYRQLPPDLAEFSGRARELRRLHSWLAAVDAGAASPVLSIEGMGGVGKTRLAVHFAHRLAAAGRFADRQLYVDLQGHAAVAPADPAAVLASFLQLLGVSGKELPSELADRAELYRDRLRGLHCLVLLDNAASVGQVTPLLPATPTALVLTTSRRTLALAGTDRLRLDGFTRPEARILLTRVIGPDRVRADPAATDRLLERCGRLPLAVALAARRLQARPQWTVADLAERLAGPDGTGPGDTGTGTGSRLGELTAGDRRLSAAFDLSYQALPAQLRHRFRLLGLHPGPDFTAASVAALAGIAPATARRTLDRLADENLVHQAAAGRYQLHDLVREYAAELARRDGPKRCREAVSRVLDWYLAGADAAQRTLYPERVVRAPDCPAVPHQPRFSDDRVAFRWLETEYASLLAGVSTAADHGCWQLAWQLPAALRSYFEWAGRPEDWLRAAESGLAAARRAGDLRGQARMANEFGAAHAQLGRPDLSIDHYRRAVELYRILGDAETEAVMLANLGAMYAFDDRPDEGIAHLQRALTAVRTFGLRVTEARVLSNLGRAYVTRGQYQQAIDHLRGAMAIPEHSGNPVEHAVTVTNLGNVLWRAGRPAEAIPLLRDARQIQQSRHALRQEAATLDTLGHALADTGRPEQARECWEGAVTILRELRHPKADAIAAKLDRMISRPVEGAPAAAAGRPGPG